MDSGDEASSSRPVASFVCDICQGFGDMESPRGFILKLEPGEKVTGRDDEHYIYVYMHHHNIGTLLAYEQEGCNVCAIVYRSFWAWRKSLDEYDGEVERIPYSSAREYNQPDSVANDGAPTAARLAGVMKQDRAFTYERLRKYDGGRIVLMARCDQESGPRGSSKTSQSVDAWVLGFPELHGYNSSFTVFNSGYDPLDPELKHRPCNNLLSRAHISLINRWRDACKMEHRSCCETINSQPLPSRVLELVETGDRQNPCGVRLIETHRMMQGTYACLSYCWGDSEPRNQTGQTTTVNMTKQLQSLPFDSLPRTIIDTIHLCYKLGFRFLWIDRLCIIQDDQEDWKKEASRMCDVYSRSALTVSVPLCIESSQSFLKKRNVPYPVGKKGSFATMDYIDKESKALGGLCFVQGSLARGQASWFLENSWDYFPYGASHYGNRWITRGWTLQEWMLSPRVLHIDTMTLWDCFEGYANELNRRYMEKAIVVRDPRALGRQISWESIVEDYSSREITHEKDRLPALDGLAARYHQSTGYTYLAGLWLEQMPRSLLWQRHFTEAPEPVNRTVPSWSWASLNTEAKWANAVFKAVAWVDPFHPYASINRWPTFSSSVSMNEDIWIDIKGHISVVVDQISEGPEVRDNHLVKAGNKWWDSVPDHALKYPDDEMAQSNIYLIVLGLDKHSSPTSGTYGGLVLQKCGWDNGQLCFRRLGMATLKLDTTPWLDGKHGSSWELQVVHLV